MLKLDLKPSDTVLIKVHGIDKGVNLNFKTRKTSNEATEYNSTATHSQRVKGSISSKTQHRSR